MYCETCKFWEQDKSSGWCHRYAPRARIMDPTEEKRPMDTLWPRTRSEEWCGEWQAKVEVEAEG